MLCIDINLNERFPDPFAADRPPQQIPKAELIMKLTPTRPPSRSSTSRLPTHMHISMRVTGC